MVNPTISVIVPVYNVEKYLCACIDSILAQTFTDFELILVDDGSTDNCGVICDEYSTKSHRIIVIHQKNSGVSAARNTGIDLARGAYISFVDSDDIVDSHYLERLYSVLLENCADISTCKFDIFNDCDFPVYHRITNKQAFVLTGKEACISLYKGDGRTHVTSWGKLYSRHLFCNIRFPLGKLHEDDAVTPRLFYYAKKIAVCHNHLYFYRTRNGSIMSSGFSSKRFDCLEAIDACISFFKENDESEILSIAYIFREKTRSLYILAAHNAGIKKEIPTLYHCSQIHAIMNLAKILPPEKFDWYVYPFYPKLVHFISYLRKIKRILLLKN